MSDTDTIDDTNILAKTLFGEARGEGGEGMQAVACVILNRVNHPQWWGNDIRSVCLHPYQFSCWNKNDPNRQKMLQVTADNPSYQLALTIAKKAMDGELRDITNGADNYFAAGTPTPSWAEGQDPCATIGNHIFFKI